MQKYIGTAIKKDVNNPPTAGETPAINVDVRVVVTSTGALATIYSDNGTTVIDQNNYKTDANGNHEFYAANGRYTVRYLLPSGTVEYSDISLFDINDYTPPGEAELKMESIETVRISNDTDLTITPPQGGRVCITYMSAIVQNSVFSLSAGGNTLISSGSKTLLTAADDVSNANQFKVGDSSGGATNLNLTFSIDDAVTINRGGGADIVMSYTIESPQS